MPMLPQAKAPGFAACLAAVAPGCFWAEDAAATARRRPFPFLKFCLPRPERERDNSSPVSQRGWLGKRRRRREKKRRAAYGWLLHPSLASHKEGSAASPQFGRSQAGLSRDWNRRRQKHVSTAGSQKLELARSRRQMEENRGGPRSLIALLSRGNRRMQSSEAFENVG